jgi:hemolysin III
MDLLNFREPFNTWSHGLWLLLSIPATIVLWRRSGRDRAMRISLLIFGLSLAACYLGSAVFHAVRVTRASLDLFDRLDHVGIHLLIAGSYTPVAWNLLRGRWRTWTLAAVWGTSILASALLLAQVRLPRPVATCEYLALGWGSLFCYVEIARVVPGRVMRPLVIGGVFYSIGAVLNLLHWPRPWPGVFGSHEIFHLWVMAGSSAHFWFMITAVIPFAGAAGSGATPQWLNRKGRSTLAALRATFSRPTEPEVARDGS